MGSPSGYHNSPRSRGSPQELQQPALEYQGVPTQRPLANEYSLQHPAAAGEAPQQQNKKKRSHGIGKIGLGIATLAMLAAAAGGYLHLKPSVRFEMPRLEECECEAAKEFEELRQAWTKASDLVRKTFVMNFFPRERGVSLADEDSPLVYYEQKLEDAKALAKPQGEREIVDHTMRLKLLSAVLRAARVRVENLQALEALLEGKGISLPQAEGFIEYREYSELLSQLNQVPEPDQTPLSAEQQLLLQLATAYHVLKDNADREVFAIYKDYMGLMEALHQQAKEPHKEGDEELPFPTFKVLPTRAFFPFNIFANFLRHMEEINKERCLPFKDAEELIIPQSVAAAIQMLKAFEKAAVEGHFKCERLKTGGDNYWVSKTQEAEELDLGSKEDRQRIHSNTTKRREEEATAAAATAAVAAAVAF
ncbi:hypothetical protein Efla_001417 [Eimeria flavescens]